MPVKKNNNTKSKVNVNTAAPAWRGSHGAEFAKKLLVTLLGILLVYLIMYVGVLIRNNIKEYSYIGKADRMERTITLDAVGRATARPDIAMTSIGMVSEAPTVAEAQQKNTTVMNALLDRVKILGVEKADVQTQSYNVYPVYDYSDNEGRQLRGYEVSQQVAIKIRDLDKANQILALVGEVGANTVSGLQFTIDDREVYRAEARDAALEKIIAKANALSESLGVDMVGIVSYDEFEAGGPVPEAYARSSVDYGLGGGAPSVEPGSTDVYMNVSVTFEIR